MSKFQTRYRLFHLCGRTKLQALLAALFTVTLCVSPASAQPKTVSSSQYATIGGARSCRLIQLTVTHASGNEGVSWSWLSYTITECASGSQTPTVIVAKQNIPIPEGAYTIDRSSEHLRTNTADGLVDITWTVTTDVHQTFNSSAKSETPSSVTQEDQSTDTRSASPTGAIGRFPVNGYSSVVVTASTTNSTR